MSHLHVSGSPVSNPPAGDPPTTNRAARAREIRRRLRHPPNAVPDNGIDLKRQKIAPPPAAPRSEARARRGHVLETPPPEPAGPVKPIAPPTPTELTIAEVRSLDRQINMLVAELERLYARVEQHYLARIHRRPTTETIQRAVARHYGVTVVDLMSARRSKDVMFARHVAIYLVRQHTLLSLPAIGQLFGNRDHTTILHAARRIKALRERDPELSETLDKLAALIAAMPDRACLASPSTATAIKGCVP